MQIVTGIFLTMHYKPDAADARSTRSRYIMRDVEWGWLIRYMHSTGASMFFIVVYLHMFRGLMYGSYQKPRELVWLLGMLIFLALMAEAFMGYVLPWGNMSFWGAKVIISLFGAIPLDRRHAGRNGSWATTSPADATLNRFFALHVIALPLVLLLLVVLHIAALHEVGSNNPDGVEIKKGRRATAGRRLRPPTAFRSTRTTPRCKDLFGVGFFLIMCAFIIFFQPTVGGWFLENDNFIRGEQPGDAGRDQAGLVLHSVLRDSARDPEQGPRRADVRAGRRSLLFLMPWLDRGTVKSIRYRGRGFRDRAWHLRRRILASSARSVRARPTEWIPELFGANADLTSIGKSFRAHAHGHLFRLLRLPVGLYLLWLRKDQTGTGAGDHPCMSRRINQP